MNQTATPKASPKSPSPSTTPSATRNSATRNSAAESSATNAAATNAAATNAAATNTKPTTSASVRATNEISVQDSAGQAQDTSDHESEDAPRVNLKSKGWTLGNSAKLVAGTDEESKWVTLGWLVIPTVVFALFLLALMNT